MALVRSSLLIASAALLAGAVAAGAGGASGGEADKAPDAILADAVAGVRQAQSYHVRLTDADGGVLTADVIAPGQGRATLRDGRVRYRLVVTATTSYINADRAFWSSILEDAEPGVARKLAGRWLRESTRDDVGSEYRLDVDSLLDDLRPARIAKCLVGRTGTLTKTAADDGAIVLRDAGDEPGTAPRRYEVSATPPIVLTRIVQSGHRRKGAKRDMGCAGSDGDTSTRWDLRLSHYGQVAPVTAPRGAVTVEQALGGSS